MDPGSAMGHDLRGALITHAVGCRVLAAWRRGSDPPHGGRSRRSRALSCRRGIPKFADMQVGGKMQLWSGYSDCAAGECATDAETWAVQQLVTIPGWLYSIKIQDIKRNSFHL
jgi:hypothetical protein